MSSVAQSSSCVHPVTPLPGRVDPATAPVFGRRQVYPPGDAPKAARRQIGAVSRPAGLRLKKGICVEVAQARECGSMTCIELSEKLCIPVTRRLQSITHLRYYANSGADADTLPALPVTRHPLESSPALFDLPPRFPAGAVLFAQHIAKIQHLIIREVNL